MKTAKYLSFEQQRFELASKHVHQVDDLGLHVIFGNGFSVMRVLKPQRNCPKGAIYFIGPDDPGFKYEDYFLPEEIDGTEETISHAGQGQRDPT